MADKFKLDEHGKCTSCTILSKDGEHVKCFLCDELFHVVCTSASADEKVASKTTVSYFLLPSTKNNFRFFCDKCMTEMEINRANADSQRLNLLEKKMSAIDKQLSEISSTLKNKTEKTIHANPKQKPLEASIWNDTNRLATVKAPPSTAALVVPKIPDQTVHSANKIIIEKTIVDNQIVLQETYTNKSGDLVLVCESTEMRDELKNLVHTAKQDITMTAPKVKHQSITIVGMEREYTAEDIKKMIPQQNVLIKKFAEANSFDEHFKIHSVKPLRNNPERFQAFASVSETLREGFKKSKDKLIIGVNSCKIYDRIQTKRCNNCQKFGHFIANCPTPNESSCGKCSENHATKDCTVTERGCINCKRSNLECHSHSAFYHKCPSLLQFQAEAEKNQTEHLNSIRQTRNPQG